MASEKQLSTSWLYGMIDPGGILPALSSVRNGAWETDERTRSQRRRSRKRDGECRRLGTR
jgi:hypothetical protein